MSLSPTDTRLAPEARRIESLIRRQGLRAAREWIGRTIKIYREAINNPLSHASRPEYRPLFKRSIDALEHWLAMTSGPDENSRDE